MAHIAIVASQMKDNINDNMSTGLMFMRTKAV